MTLHPYGRVLAFSTFLPAATAALRFVLRPAMPDPPVLGLRVAGPLAAPARTPELSDVIRWRAEHPPAQ